MKMELTLEPVGSLCEWGRAGDSSISDSVRERAGGGYRKARRRKCRGLVLQRLLGRDGRPQARDAPRFSILPPPST